MSSRTRWARAGRTLSVAAGTGGRRQAATSTASTTSWSSTSTPPGRGGPARAARRSHALGLAWAEKQRTITGALDGFEASLRATETDNTSTDETQSAAFVRSQQRLG